MMGGSWHRLDDRTVRGERTCQTEGSRSAVGVQLLDGQSGAGGHRTAQAPAFADNMSDALIT